MIPPAKSQPNAAGDNEWKICVKASTQIHPIPDIENGRYPFRAIDPEGLDQNSYNGDPPNNGKQDQSGTSFQSDQTDWSIASCNKDKDHHVIDLFQ